MPSSQLSVLHLFRPCSRFLWWCLSTFITFVMIRNIPILKSNHLWGGGAKSDGQRLNLQLLKLISHVHPLPAPIILNTALYLCVQSKNGLRTVIRAERIRWPLKPYQSEIPLGLTETTNINKIRNIIITYNLIELI